MERTDIEISLRVTRGGGGPWIESRARFPRERKTLVVRMPILPPGATDEEVLSRTERRVVED